MTLQTTPSATEQPGPPSGLRTARRPLLLLAAAVTVALLCLLSLAVGSRAIPLGQVIDTLVDRDGARVTPDVEAIVWGSRLPRTLLAMLAGAALALAGAIMQGLTRNPLADPGLLGISAGAAFGTVLAAGVMGITSLYGFIWFSFAGALAAGALVYLMGSRGRSGSSPVKLALAGIAVTYLLDSITSGIALTDPEALDHYRYWSAGSVTGHDGDTILSILPFCLAGAVLALSLAPALNALALGDDVATALGRRLGRVRLLGAVTVTLLTGAVVAVTGPIIFVGLVVPHAVRMITGPDHRWLLPGSMLVAPCLLLVADIIGRVIARPAEVDVSLVAAFLGAPVFIALVRRRRLAEL